MGKLIYLSYVTLVIVYSIGILNQFIHDPREFFVLVIEKVLQYLKGTPLRRLLFKRTNDMIIEIFTYVNYVGSIITQHSTFEYCTFFRGNLISWQSKKQQIVARANTESEFSEF